MDINILGNEYGAFLARSMPMEDTFALAVFYEMYNGTPPRETLQRTRSALCGDIVRQWVWDGLVSLK